ncbi:MAG: response regulator SirA, partial [Elusimicrobia bacterium]|nr:response regulator SirA [Elusimicrobiota bacterium]
MSDSKENQLYLFHAPERNKISHIIKRDGRVVAFNRMKIVNAIYKAALSVGGENRELAELLADKVLKQINQIYPAGATPSVEEVQDLIEKILIENNHAKTAKSFILYRAERQRIRSKKDERIVVEDNIPYKVLWKVFTWNVDHHCDTVEKLNHHLEKGTWPKLIQEAEKAYHDEIGKVSQLILKRLPDVRLVIVAGPSSSGKTTTTMKISEKLAERGVSFVLLGLDNYFRDLIHHPKDEYGDYDFERPEALDLELINDHLDKLLDGKTIHMPIYNFKTGQREKRTQEFRLMPNQILLIDSLHGLYDGMTASVPPETKFKFYIEALCQVRDTNGEFVRWADLRMLRRMVRDQWQRNYDPLRTVGHWHYVRRSEKRHIVPFIHQADTIFNGSLP